MKKFIMTVFVHFEDDRKENWTLKEGLGCENGLALKVNPSVLKENIGHEIKRLLRRVVLMKCLLVFVGK